ncbi:hypothetical protein [Streptomyces violaceusniger]|uniref:Secreted protein n=1 Tax=Streptomyces violaceusniger (strain Tu 4113) TaxID=653045 RepID=G2P3Q1_STRV4|nr:hypothetical protein [Streptomyces violaceusniger]AEM84386.1 hypothetical protein Strvi_4828 [Streptomyces violaceusniger Tu 4113]
MRLATTLLLIGTLLGVAPAAAHAAPARDSVSYVALSSKRGGGTSGGGGVSKVGGNKKSKGGGYSSRSNGGRSSSGKKKMPLWQAILFLLLLGALIVWAVVKLVRKFRKFVSA